MLNNKTILVTGGSGFIGSWVVDKLVDNNFDVVVIDREKPKYKNKQAKYYILDLIFLEIDNVFKKHRIDYVIHLAAQTSVNVSIENPTKDSSDNILATVNLLEHCKKYGVKKIIASSSAAVYGNCEQLPIDEKCELNPLTPYAVSKYTMEQYIKISGIDYLILRFSNVYGFRQKIDSDAGVVAIFMNKMFKKIAIEIFSDGEQLRDFVYVKDIASVIVNFINSDYKNEIFNISTEKGKSINELFEELKPLFDFNIPPLYKTQRDGDIRNSILSNKKILKTGILKNTDLQTGLRETVDLFKAEHWMKSAENRSILVVIPARGGSVGVPRKNIRSLGAKPLISYSIKTALSSKFDLDVYVSSDDEEILTISSKLGAQVYKRDKSIADSVTTLDRVVYDAYSNISKQNNKNYDLVITLQPTSPLLNVKSLDEAIEKILANPNLDTIISAKESTHLSWRKENNEFVPNYEKRLNRQYLTPNFVETGAFLITKGSIVAENNRIGKNILLHLLEKKEAIDIDSYEDFGLCEYYLKKKSVLFVVKGYNEVGFGHVYRTLLLANKITEHSVKFLFEKESFEGYEKAKASNFKVFMQENQDIIDDIKKFAPDVVINDILDTDEDYTAALKDLSIKVINFEDLGTGIKNADLVVNALYEDDERTEGLNVYSGASYFCARDEFLLAKTKNIAKNVKNILITFGGTDPSNFTYKVLDAVYDYCIDNKIEINVVMGLGYNQESTLKKFPQANLHKDVKAMSDFMSNADIVFTALGRTVFEIACIGIPTIVMAQSEREMQHKFACDETGFLNLGIGYSITPERLLEYFKTVVNDFEQRKMMNVKMLSQNLRKGTYNVMKLIYNVIESKDCEKF